MDASSGKGRAGVVGGIIEESVAGRGRGGCHRREVRRFGREERPVGSGGGREEVLVVLQKAADDGTRRRGERRRRVQMADDGDGKSWREQQRWRAAWRRS